MTKTEEMSDPESCLNRAAPNEPVFVLRASDVLASDLVRDWAERLAELRRMDAKLGRAPRDLSKSQDAMHVATQMDEWAAKHGCKVPD